MGKGTSKGPGVTLGSKEAGSDPLGTPAEDWSRVQDGLPLRTQCQGPGTGLMLSTSIRPQKSLVRNVHFGSLESHLIQRPCQWLLSAALQPWCAGPAGGGPALESDHSQHASPQRSRGHQERRAAGSAHAHSLTQSPGAAIQIMGDTRMGKGLSRNAHRWPSVCPTACCAEPALLSLQWPQGPTGQASTSALPGACPEGPSRGGPSDCSRRERPAAP